jgi:hypothetical protein
LVHQNVTAVCSRNRSVVLAGRTRFNKHPPTTLSSCTLARPGGTDKRRKVIKILPEAS